MMSPQGEAVVIWPAMRATYGRARIAWRATRVRVPQAGPHQRWSRRLRMKNWPQLGASQYASAGEESNSTADIAVRASSSSTGSASAGATSSTVPSRSCGTSATAASAALTRFSMPIGAGCRRAAASSSAKIASRSSRTSISRVSASCSYGSGTRSASCAAHVRRSAPLASSSV